MELIRISLEMSFLILVILGIRSVFGSKLPNRIFITIWILITARLLLPLKITIQSTFLRTFLSGPPILNNLITDRNTSIDKLAQTNTIAGSGFQSHAVVSQPMRIMPDTFTILILIWITGICIFTAYFLLKYIRECHKFRTSLRAENEYVREWMQEYSLMRKMDVRVSDQISGPLTYGMIKPVILLPKHMEWDDRAKIYYILTHEYIHICRFDGLLKFLFLAAVILHWFNPVVWMMVLTANKDMEILCDEKVVHIFGSPKRAMYARTLIGMEENRNAIIFNNYFNRNAIEERITAIMKKKEFTTKGKILTAATVIVASMIFSVSVFALSTNGDSQPQVMVSTSSSSTMTGDTDTQVKDDPLNDVDWWTYDGYKAEVAKLKKEYQDALGTPGFETQKKVDDAKKLLDDDLKMMKEGGKISKAKYIGNNHWDVEAMSPMINNNATSSTSESDTNSGETVAGDSLSVNHAGDTAASFTYTLPTKDGGTKSFSSVKSEDDLIQQLKQYCNQQVAAGKMTQKEAEKYIEQCK